MKSFQLSFSLPLSHGAAWDASTGRIDGTHRRDASGRHRLASSVGGGRANGAAGGGAAALATGERHAEEQLVQLPGVVFVVLSFSGCPTVLGEFWLENRNMGTRCGSFIQNKLP